MLLSISEISDIFEKFNSLKALVIGDVMVDSYLWGKVERISPEAPVPIVVVNKRENRLGGAANVALNLNSLGATTILCSVIGDEPNADLFVSLLGKQNLTTKGIVKNKNRITTTKFRIIGNNAQMLRFDEEIESFLNEEDTLNFYTVINNLVESEKIDVIIFEDYDKGIITPLLIKKVVELAEKKSIPIVADPKRKNFNEYKNLSLFKPNLKELVEGIKLDILPKNQKDFENAVETFQLRNNIDMMMVTRSEAGVYISSKNKNSNVIDKRHNIAAHIRNIADVSGAGDTVISVASLCLALKLEPFIIASLSNLAGGLVCEEVGVVPVNKEKLIQETIDMMI